MKCPKCAYLGFENGDRCRNCGYEFSLTPAPAPALDFVLDREIEQSRPPLDLDRVIGAPSPVTLTPADLPLFSPVAAEAAPAAEPEWRSLPVGRGRNAEDAPLISALSPPRAPLGVRRATPEVPRARPARRTETPSEPSFFATPSQTPAERTVEPKTPISATGESPAGPSRRIMAGLLDVSLLSVVDAGVLYFTLRLLGLTTAEMSYLPALPLVAFFLLLNGGYFVAFTAVGGQSIGKMALGIKVMTQEDESVPIGRATLRTLAYLVSALPLGAGFLPGVMSADRLALHDRLAHTRVVRPS